jgi:hypothetical protein
MHRTVKKRIHHAKGAGCKLAAYVGGKPHAAVGRKAASTPFLDRGFKKAAIGYVPKVYFVSILSHEA